MRAYEGGLAEWVSKGFPVVGKCGKDYLQRCESGADEDRGVKTITAEQLKKEMEEAGLF